jgi:transposase
LVDAPDPHVHAYNPRVPAVHAISEDLAALKRLVLELQLEIERLKGQLARERHARFGRSSERTELALSQLQLSLDAVGAVMAAAESPQVPQQQAPASSRARCRASSRKPAHLPRETLTYVPAALSTGCGCPNCGGRLRKLGEDVAETLEYVPATFKVVRHVREKHSCVKCSTIVQAPAPSRPIERGMAGPALLAHVLTAKYCDHAPLYRQTQIYARSGVILDRSLLAQWVGAAHRLLQPLIDAVGRHVLSADKLHADDTPLPVLEPGRGRVRRGYLWTYVRDERPWASGVPPAVWYQYSPNRRGEHPRRHLRHFRGVLQADAYSGFDRLYEAERSDELPRVQEAGCRVGRDVAAPAPHRPGRADFPHPVPHVTDSLAAA